MYVKSELEWVPVFVMCLVSEPVNTDPFDFRIKNVHLVGIINGVC